jgi:hypothetical protein
MIKLVRFWYESKGEREGRYLILRSRIPVGYSGRVCDALLQTVGSKCTKGDGGSAIDAADCPEWNRHLKVECCYSHEVLGARLWLACKAGS